MMQWYANYIGELREDWAVVEGMFETILINSHSAEKVGIYYQDSASFYSDIFHRSQQIGSFESHILVVFS